MTEARTILPIREGLARAIYDKPTRFDGDVVGTHLSQSYVIDASATDAAQLRAFVIAVCEDIADAALSYLHSRHLLNDIALSNIKDEEAK